jgi:hypothetical protein
MSESKPCLVCDRPLSFAWTDSHGIAQCTTCGAPYRIFHYDGEGEQRKRITKEPDLLIEPEPAQRCFRETGARLSAVGLQLSFPGGYDVASRDDIERVTGWWKANAPKENAS